MDLLERLQAATEGSRELDAYIWAFADNREVRINDNDLVLAKSRVPPHDECLLGTIDPGKVATNFQIAGGVPPFPHYTTSIDAALTLHTPGKHSNKAAFIHAAMHQMSIGDIPDERLALHLCIAALKAHKDSGLSELTAIAQETDTLK